ncbi:alkaline phosphatase, partial [Streptomyces sp. NRRL S-444]
MAPIPHTRRSLLGGSLAVPVGLALSGALAAPALAAPADAPAFTRSGRPSAPWGVQSGEITAHSATVWTRSDRPARMYVETSPSESFRYGVRRHGGPFLGPATDFTGTTTLRD